MLTHDITTMKDLAYARVAAGLPMPGGIEINDRAPIGVVINDLLLVIEATSGKEWESQVRYLPL